MMSHLSFNTSVFTPSNVPTVLFHQYGNLRYQCFTKDDPFVALNHRDQTEFDHFDRDEGTSYIMVYTAQGDRPHELMSAMRIRPTLMDYELEMSSYQYLTKGINLPKDSSLYEGSRWVGKSSRTSAGMLSTAMLVSKLYHMSRDLAFDEIIGTISTLSENWLSKRSADAERGSSAFYSKRDNLDILVSRIKINESFLDVANKLLQSALKDLNLEQVMVTQPTLKLAA